MSTVDEILALEEQLRRAELGPDPGFFELYLADDAILDGQRLKAKIVAAHQPGDGPKFTEVTMQDVEVVDHGPAAVVTCTGTYRTPKGSVTLRFMRVWVKTGDRWQIVAGTTT